MPIPAGSRLGPYEIVAPIGAGGMGEVYRARDTKLNRDVAIKVLPGEFASNPPALARFEREAQAVAALSHPNILAIHDFGSEGGVAYAVTELLDGETLRERMAEGALPARKAVEYAVQIVRGIAAAHEKGIIHRDLKPENIFVTRDGRVKVLDFGLAKAGGPGTRGRPGGTPLGSTTGGAAGDLAGAGEAAGSVAGGAPFAGDTQTALGTEPGTVMGTVGYMSPEQVRGLTVDHRTDIFSFGAVLYEMLAGRRAFKGDSQVETMNAILKEDPPDFAETNLTIPGPLDRIVRRCLEKQPAERFHSAHDLAIALEAVSGSSSSSSASLGVAALAPERRFVRGRLTLAIGAVAVVALVVGAYLAGRYAGSSGAHAAPEYQRVTFRRGVIPSARLAPDGNTIVYSALWDGTLQLYSTRPGSPESLLLPFPGADVVSISPAGDLALVGNRRSVSHYSRVGTLARAQLSGGGSREILEDVQDADWLPDGSNLVVSHYSGGRYRLEFPIGKVVYETGGWISDPRVSPDGGSVAFLDHPIMGDDRGMVAIVDRAGKVRRLTGEYESTQGLAWWGSGGEIWYTGAEHGSARGLMAVTLSGAVRTVDRTPGALKLGDIGKDGTVLLSHDNQRRGILGLAPGESKERDLSWLDWSLCNDLSQDGKMLLFSEQGDGGGPGYSVYIRKTDGSPAVRLGGGDGQAISPDGRWVLTLRLNPAPSQLVLLPTGAGDAKPVTNDSITHFTAAFLPDGKRIVFTGFEKGPQSRTYIQDLEGGAPRPVTPEGVTGLLVSPDGTLLIADKKIYPIAGGDPRPIAGLDAKDGIIRWTADGRGLFVRRLLDSGSVEISRLDPASGTRTPVRQVAPAVSFAGPGAIGQILLTADASGYVYSYPVNLSDLYLVKGLN